MKRNIVICPCKYYLHAQVNLRLLSWNYYSSLSSKCPAEIELILYFGRIIFLTVWSKILYWHLVKKITSFVYKEWLQIYEKKNILPYYSLAGIFLRGNVWIFQYILMIGKEYTQINIHFQYNKLECNVTKYNRT